MNTNTKKQNREENDMSFLSQYAGQGLEDMAGSAVAVPYLAMVQPGSQATVDGIEAGHWRNSATNQDYGETLRVIVLDFKRVWAEKSGDGDGMTVARYIPGSVPVEYKQPPKGKKGFPTMINPDSGNEIQEQFIYVLLLADHPEDGYLMFNPAVGNMKVCRSWNSRIRGQVMPVEDANGNTVSAQAPSFAFVWNIGIQMIQNPRKPAEQIGRLSIIGREGLVDEGLFGTAIQPKLQSAKNELLAITNNESDADNE